MAILNKVWCSWLRVFAGFRGNHGKCWVNQSRNGLCRRPQKKKRGYSQIERFRTTRRCVEYVPFAGRLAHGTRMEWYGLNILPIGTTQRTRGTYAPRLPRRPTTPGETLRPRLQTPCKACATTPDTVAFTLTIHSRRCGRVGHQNRARVARCAQ